MTNGMTTPPTDYHALGDSASVAEPTVLITSPRIRSTPGGGPILRGSSPGGRQLPDWLSGWSLAGWRLLRLPTAAVELVPARWRWAGPDPVCQRQPAGAALHDRRRRPW